jgi:hypothetical protein
MTATNGTATVEQRAEQLADLRRSDQLDRLTTIGRALDGALASVARLATRERDYPEHLDVLAAVLDARERLEDVRHEVEQDDEIRAAELDVASRWSDEDLAAFTAAQQSDEPS